MRTYSPPPLDPADVVADLAPVDAGSDVLRPETLVTIRNRGVETLLGMFDGQHYKIPPGLARLRYDAAQHFKDRLIVPGSREASVQRGGALRATSYLGILGLDDPQDCDPFTHEELEAFGLKTEGLDRGTMPRPSDRAVSTVPTRTVRGRVPRQGAAAASRTPRRDQVGEQHSDEAAERAATALTPPARSEAEAEDAEAAAEARGRRR